MDINKVDLSYFEFLKENFSSTAIVTGITISLFTIIIVFMVFYLGEGIRSSEAMWLSLIIAPILVFSVIVFALTMNYLIVKDSTYKTKGYTKVVDIKNLNPKTDDANTIRQQLYFKDKAQELYVIELRYSRNIEKGDKISIENNGNIIIENHKIEGGDSLDISIKKEE